mmetsp:Transcript_32687/g.96356  ORF Transcript_32687/g.96356 Transcript_32687/m.96356 type:complete len:214 (+) Transcript_32687:276-917(+)
MPCLSIPGSNLARCGTLRPPSSSMRTSPNTVVELGHSGGYGSGSGRAADGAPAASYSVTAAVPADRPALPSSMTGGGDHNAPPMSNGGGGSTRCASPVNSTTAAAAATNQNRQAVTDILAMSPSRITRPQIRLVEASLPWLDSANLIPPMSSVASSAAAPAVAGGDICPPMIHSWMSKCADGALGRDPSAERMCLQVRKTFGACSHGLGGGSL